MGVPQALRPVSATAGMPMTDPIREAEGTTAMAFLCDCLAPDAGSRVKSWPFSERPVNGAILTTLATNHHVVPHVYRALRAAAIGGVPIPKAWLEHLQACCRSITAYNLHALGLLHHLQQVMGKNGITLLPIKGPALALQAYGDVAARQFEDLDLVVRQEDLLAAVDILEEEGFTLRELADNVDRRQYLKTHLNWSMQRRGYAPLDLKSVLISHTISRPGDLAWLEADRYLLSMDNARELQVPGPESMLLAVCLDGAHELWVKLSSVADVAMLLTRFADRNWPEFLGRCARYGYKRAMLVGAGLARNLLGISLPDVFSKALEQDAAAQRLIHTAEWRLRELQPRQAIIVRQCWFVWKTLERGRDKWRYAYRLIFIPGAFELSMWPVPGIFRGVYFVLRPLRLVWNAIVGGGREQRLARPVKEVAVPDGMKDHE